MTPSWSKDGLPVDTVIDGLREDSIRRSYERRVASMKRSPIRFGAASDGMVSSDGMGTVRSEITERRPWAVSDSAVRVIVEVGHTAYKPRLQTDEELSERFATEQDLADLQRRVAKGIEADAAASSSEVHAVMRVEGPDLASLNERIALSSTADNWLRTFGLFLPKRVREEEVGDAMETIVQILTDPTYPNPRRAVFWKIASTMFWLAVNTVRHFCAAVRGTKAE
jgi:hypothetical protein